MKSLLFIIVLTLSAQVARSQLLNPTVIQQDTDIMLQNTDVYYDPFDPPDSLDTREQLSSIALYLRDSNGVNRWNEYKPMTHGVELARWHPHRAWPDTIGPTATWMRLFQAKDKPSGAHSDIIVGKNVAPPDTVITWPLDCRGCHPDTAIIPKDTGDVIISKNEDVDFRASGTIRMEDGFHVMPGAYFHAYQEPKWDTTVFSDEFDDTAKFNRQWVIWDSAAGGVQCSYASNLALDTSFDAHDGHALRLDFWKDSLCNCVEVWGGASSQNCEFLKTTNRHQNIFSAVNLKSCPWPWDSAGDPARRAYHNAPYGKYEVREKIPNFKHHTNAYSGDQSNEYNLYETYGGDMTLIHPGLSKQHVFGPFKGWFSEISNSGHDTAVFRSADAHFANWNKPYAIIIGDFPYEVRFRDPTLTDTLLVANATTEHQGGLPSSLVADSLHEVTFYYVKPQYDSIVSDSLGWSVDSTGRYFTGAYADSSGHLLYFNKSYQPSVLYLQDDSLPPGSDPVKYDCHWDHSSGKVYLNSAMSASSSHIGIGFSYRKEEGPMYPNPPVPMDFTDYKYHTFTMELLPHEAHFLVDGYLVRRFPDRLIPRTDFRYDYVTSMARTPFHLEPGEIDFEGDSAAFAAEKLWFETYDTSLLHGAWDVHGHHAAHHLIDYVKVWDVPSDMKLPDFPR